MNMKHIRHFLTAATVCGAIMGAQAQSTPARTSQPAQSNCLMSITDKDWQAWGLNAEQLEKVKDLQRELWNDEGSEAEGSEVDEGETPVAESYDARVMEVLTPAQYDSWTKWCATHAAKAEQKRME